jgi:hypothetical protein
MWMPLSFSFALTRHELGHNYGHPHHLANKYEWRIDRGISENRTDGFDMMSGANSFDISDFTAASKWWFNWIPNESVVLMQPEGPSSYCPKCVASVQNLVLHAFDDRTINPSSDVLTAVHIPITSRNGKMYSYWLSYRGNLNPLAASGLSVHVAWFSFGGLFGAEFNSLNYDAFGDTETLDDSFVTPGTCFVVTPPGIMMDIDPASTEAIQPIACVSNVLKGQSITISVSFLNQNSPPVSNIKLSTDQYMECSTGGSSSGSMSLTIQPGNVHMLRYNSTGSNGKVQLSFCRNLASSPMAKAYFYDS